MSESTLDTIDRPAPSGAIESSGQRHAHIGWPRAILSGLVILVVGFAAAIIGTDRIITGLTSLSRDQVVLIATGFFLLCIVVAAWVLRRLQSRGVI